MGIGQSRHSKFICTITEGKGKKVYNNYFLKSLPNGYYIGDAVCRLLTVQMQILYDHGPSHPFCFALYDQTYDNDGTLGQMEVYVPSEILNIDPVNFTLFDYKFHITFSRAE
jgi:hypothetical protein